MKTTIILLATLSLSVSCSKVEKAEKNMDTMTKQTKEMGSTTDKMKETTTIMYEQIRSKEAEDTRNKKFEILNSDEEKIGAKLAAAAVYFKSFEFQLWTGTDEFDSQHVREVLFLDATNEFTRRICDIYDEVDTRKMSPTKEGKKHSKEHSFYALATAMHMNHHYQEELVSNKAGIQDVSFYDLVKEALRKEAYGEELKEHEEVLVSGQNKEIMIELIKARVDFLSALGLKNLTDKRNMTLGQKIKAALFKVTGGLLGSIELPETFSKSNEATKDQTIKYLDAAASAKTFLSEIGVEKKLEPTLKSAFSKIEMGKDKGEPEVGETKEDSDLKREQIASLIDGLMK